MNLEQLIRLQYEFDTNHGWNPDKDVPAAVFQAVENDLIGIIGEIGEFANVVKKIRLETNLDPGCDIADQLKSNSGKLSEELVDALIYLIRLAGHLNIDMEQAYKDRLSI
jgi:NTP pyrophosphatase (non-canonical NTP hydrolase)